jgi:hypothetical protein
VFITSIPAISAAQRMTRRNSSPRRLFETYDPGAEICPRPVAKSRACHSSFGKMRSLACISWRSRSICSMVTRHWCTGTRIVVTTQLCSSPDSSIYAK